MAKSPGGASRQADAVRALKATDHPHRMPELSGWQVAAASLVTDQRDFARWRC
jgi:hypothetical protein